MLTKVIPSLLLGLVAQPSLSAGQVASSFEDVLLKFDVEALNKALSAGANANWVDKDSGTSALHHAVGATPAWLESNTP